MKRFLRVAPVILLLLCSLSVAAQTAPAHRMLIGQEPAPNLGQLKMQLIAYHDCRRPQGCYLPDVDRQSRLAIECLERRASHAKADEKLALVLDIDETALSNWDEMAHDDFGYIASDWNAWVEKKQATVIAGTLRLFNAARQHSVAVFFITGRSQQQEAVTLENLQAAGYHDWAGAAFRGPHPAGQSTAEYKSGERKKIVDAGYHIILNVGDQRSDLAGSPQAEVSVKLPNPFYYIP